VIDGNPETGLPPSDLAQESGAQQTWQAVRDNADSILSTRDAVLGLHEVARTLNETIPQLQVEYDDIVQILLENDAPAEQIALAQRQSLLGERIVRSVNNVLSGDEDAVIAADRFGRDASLFGRVLDGQVNGNPAMGISQVNDDDALYGLEIPLARNCKAGLNDINPQFFQGLGYTQLLGTGHGGARTLFAIPQGGVKNNEMFFGHGNSV
jgi:twitching motility protein PilJ